VRQRMAARLRRPQSAQAAPAPPGGLGINEGRCPPAALKDTQDRNLAPCLRSSIPRTSPCTALCDRLKYASHAWTGMRASAADRVFRIAVVLASPSVVPAARGPVALGGEAGCGSRRRGERERRPGRRPGASRSRAIRG
jgi:hypothetical protein